MAVYVEHERQNKWFFVYVGGDADVAGTYDRVYSYDGREVTENQARDEALEFAQRIAKKFGGLIERP